MTSLAWKAVRLGCEPAHSAFERARRDAPGSQRALLAAILHANRDTEFGRRHGFAAIRDWDDYRARVPLQSADEYQVFAQRIAAGERNLLSPRPPRFFGLTTGLGGKPKLVAHPPAGLAAFGRAARIWLADILRAWPQIGRGRAYLSISPPLAASPAAAPDAAPLGMSAPSRHLAAWGETAWGLVSIAPSRFDAEPAWCGDIAGWRLATASLLAAAEDLSLLSIASPMFFDVLWRTLLERRDEIVAAVRHGVAVPGCRPRAPDPARAAALARVLAQAKPSPTDLWPRLALISCWGHAASHAPAAALAQRFAGVPLQAKGLWATEAPVTIPLAGREWPVLAVDCAAYEFIDDDGVPHLAHELAEGRSYDIVLTTAGGLYRYTLGDVVRVRGFDVTTPLLEFAGRRGITSDLAGEKLDEAFVAGCLPRDAGTLLLIACGDERRYRLVVDAGRHDAGAADGLAAAVEAALHRHWLYADRRGLGFLHAVAPLRVREPETVIDAWFLQQGLRADGGKPLALAPFSAWETAFRAAARSSGRD